MASKGLSKEKLLQLVQAGKEHREEMVQAAPPVAPQTPPQPEPVPKPKPRLVQAPQAPTPEPVPLEPARTPEAERTRVIEPEPIFEEEPPAERPAAEMEVRAGLPRGRRVGLRSDPAWQQKTFYLKRVTIEAAEVIAKSMGVEFSELVEYALAVQVKAETRTSELSAILSARGR